MNDIMAAAEARAAWPRVANRYIVQEDAKRAPKLACCPSSASKQYFDSDNGESENGSDNSASNFTPFSWNYTNPNLSSDVKWWLQLHPNFGHQNDLFVHDRVENEVQGKTTDSYTNNLDKPTSVVSTVFMKNDFEKQIEELKAVKSDHPPWPPKHKEEDMTKHWYERTKLTVDWNAVDRLDSRVSEKDDCIEDESVWSEEKSRHPWWRVSDKDELALLVAKKSLDRIENCDLPPPMKVHVSVDPLACLGRSDDTVKLSTSSFDTNLNGLIYNHVCHAVHSNTFERIDRKSTSYDETSYSYETCSMIDDFDVDSSKVGLLEALCHSQTRARKAELAAQKAHNEKEHVVNLFLEQASHLFAYKQWVKLLQLESLHLQLKVKEHQLSTLFPVMPWMFGDKGDDDEEQREKRCSFCRYIIAFAVGMSFTGAGLILGWTLGCLFPMI